MRRGVLARFVIRESGGVGTCVLCIGIGRHGLEVDERRELLLVVCVWGVGWCRACGECSNSGRWKEGEELSRSPSKKSPHSITIIAWDLGFGIWNATCNMCNIPRWLYLECL